MSSRRGPVTSRRCVPVLLPAGPVACRDCSKLRIGEDLAAISPGDGRTDGRRSSVRSHFLFFSPSVLHLTVRSGAISTSPTPPTSHTTTTATLSLPLPVSLSLSSTKILRAQRSVATKRLCREPRLAQREKTRDIKKDLFGSTPFCLVAPRTLPSPPSSFTPPTTLPVSVLVFFSLSPPLYSFASSPSSSRHAS